MEKTMIKKMKRAPKIFWGLSMVILITLLVSPCSSFAEGRAKNVIIMVPDGMGLADVTATRIHKNGLGGAPLALETLERIGYQRTYSKNSTITESAPAASAWACGEKFNNGKICFHGDPGIYGTHKFSILELAKAKGKKAGLVATSQITHATPASFAAHVVNRNCQNEIARQYIEVTQPDVMLGGGKFKFDTDPNTDKDAAGCPQYSKDLMLEAAQEGYSVVFTDLDILNKKEVSTKDFTNL